MTKINRVLQISFWSYAFIFVVSCSLQITQVDLWYQLAEGFHILSTWTLPTAPPAAFGLPAAPYFDEYAGYEIVLALLYKLGGFPGLWLVFTAVYLAIIFLPFSTSGRTYPAFQFAPTVALFFAGLLMRTRLEQRPELVAGLFLVLLMALLRKSQLAKVSSRTLVALFFLFLAWSNTHSTFVIGFFTLGLWMGCEMVLNFQTIPIASLIRHALIAAGVTVAGALLNPYGPQRFLFPFEQASDPGSTALSQEMWPLTDFGMIPGQLLLIMVALLIWGLLTTRGVPAWLILFSIFSVFMAFKGYRFVNFLVISVLFVYAARIEREPIPSRLWVFDVLKGAALGLLCMVLIFGAAFTFNLTYQEMRFEPRLAVHTRRFADNICALKVTDSNTRVPILCEHGVGSYLSFGDSQFRPLLDSGLSHFSDDTKRYFFFLWHEPDALDLGLQHLNVDYVLINKVNNPWASTLARLPDWEFVTCDTTGMLWKRNPGGSHPLSNSDRELIGKTVRALKDSGEICEAFEFSTPLHDPNLSLDILEWYGGQEWSDAFFTHFCAWVDAQPTAKVAAYLAGSHLRQYPLVDAILAQRLGPDSYVTFMASNPPGPRPWFWTALEVRDRLQRGDRREALALFDTIFPVPSSSVAYYELWHEVRAGETTANAPALSAYGQWQTWDESSRRFVEAMSSRLNDRIAELQRPIP